MRIVVFEVDCLRPDFIGAYGNEWLPTPTMDHLAAEGVVFDWHYADRLGPDSPDGKQILEASGVEVRRCDWSMSRIREVIKALAKAEHCALIVRCDQLVPPWKLDESALEEFLDSEDEDAEPQEPFLGPLPQRIDDDETFDRLRKTYAAAVVQFDESLEQIGKEIRKRWPDALWVLTSPRGLALGAHQIVGHDGPLHEELVHLPLIMRGPDYRHAGRRVAALTQPGDLWTTIAGLLPPDQQSARGVLPLLDSVYATLRPHAITTDGVAVGVRTPEWYLLKTTPDAAAQLFVKPDDRWEVNDVARQHEDVVAELEALIRP